VFVDKLSFSFTINARFFQYGLADLAMLPILS